MAANSQPKSPSADAQFEHALLPLDGYTRWNDLKRLVPLCRESIRQRELEGRFPRRIHLSQRCAVWSNRELHKWLADPVGYRA
ncbi:helix-turn-helix transcriptional regulator [Paraburkholderia sp. GAS334]|uniref:helix-turn-helix transcriptional regulator n=1 Tax=Paraburkholderia sp. GAS334 TaxID=3035131 RepID=UPI003D227C6C